MASYANPSPTLENLQAAAYGEHEENTDMYPKFAQIAAQEGFPAIAEILKNIGYAERYHESRFRALVDAIENGTLFKQDNIVMWRCTRIFVSRNQVACLWDFDKLFLALRLFFCKINETFFNNK